MKTTGNKKWWDFWRHYKRKSGAVAYAKKHKGLWVIIECSPDILTKEEIEDMGLWVVGRADEYLFFQAKHGKGFEKYYPAIEYWKDGELLRTV